MLRTADSLCLNCRFVWKQSRKTDSIYGRVGQCVGAIRM